MLSMEELKEQIENHRKEGKEFPYKLAPDIYYELQSEGVNMDGLKKHVFKSTNKESE